MVSHEGKAHSRHRKWMGEYSGLGVLGEAVIRGHMGSFGEWDENILKLSVVAA